MKERELLIDVLCALSRRLWINRAIRDTTFGVCVVLFCLICFQLILPALVSEVAWGDTVHVALAGILSFVAAEITRRCVGRETAERAAAQADARAHLNDELKSAYCFLSMGLVSPYAELQVRRAAATASRLDLAAVAPREAPQNIILGVALGAVLAMLIWLTPQLSRTWDADQQPAFEGGAAADLRSLLKDAPPVAEIAKLDLALRELEQAKGSADDKRRALAAVRDAIDQANMEALATREVLAKLSQTLQSSPKFEGVERALDKGRIEQAMALMKKLQATAPGTTDELTERTALEERIGETQRSTDQEVNAGTAEPQQDAVKHALETLQQAGERIEVQRRVNNVKRRLEDYLNSTTQSGQLDPSQLSNRSNAPNPTSSAGTGNADVQGGTFLWQPTAAREEGNAHTGSHNGNASGDSPTLPLEGNASARLDGKLKLETFLQEYDGSDKSDGTDDTGWIYSASREQKSMVPSEAVRHGAYYDRDEAIERERVPVRQKSIVKNYFLNLHESEKQ